MTMTRGGSGILPSDFMADGNSLISFEHTPRRNKKSTPTKTKTNQKKRGTVQEQGPILLLFLGSRQLSSIAISEWHPFERRTGLSPLCSSAHEKIVRLKKIE